MAVPSDEARLAECTRRAGVADCEWRFPACSNHIVKIDANSPGRDLRQTVHSHAISKSQGLCHIGTRRFARVTRDSQSRLRMSTMSSPSA